MTAPERIQAFVKTANNHLDKGEFMPWKEKPLDLYPGYLKAIRQRHQITIHSTSDEFPEKEFRRLMSNMEDQGIEWLKDNYQPITHTVWNEFINTVTRACYNVGFEDKDVDEKVLEYLRTEIPKYQNLFAYFKQIAPKLMAKDAMSVFTAVPEDVPMREIDEETAVIDGDINPMPQNFECWRVIYFEHGKGCLVLRSEKSEVVFGQKKQPYGLIFDYIDEEKIERYIQTGKQTDYEFGLAFSFTHGVGFMPAWRSGGISEMIDNEVVYKSHFQGAVPHLNNAMQDNMLLTSVKFKCAFPTAVMVVEDCDYTDNHGSKCDSGVIKYFEDGNELEKTCPRCGGTGRSQKLNPFSTMYVPTPNRENPDKYSASEALTYVSPPTATMEFMRKETDLNLSRAASEIKIGRTINQEGDHVTATEKGIDQKATYAFIYSFAMQWAYLFNNMQKAITLMRYGANEKVIEIIEPRDFDLKTTDDYVAEIGAAQEAGLPPAVISSLVASFMYSNVEGSYVAEKTIETIIAADRIFEMGAVDAMALGDRLQKWELTLHLSSYNIISNLIAEDEKWPEKELDVRVAEVKAKAQEITPTGSNAAVEALDNLGG